MNRSQRLGPNRLVVRPVAVAGDTGGSSSLYSYKTTSGSTSDPVTGKFTGWAKTWYSIDAAGDISEPIGNATWEVGVNVLMDDWYESALGGAGTFGYTSDCTVETTGTTAATIALKALDASEVVLGTFWTGTFSEDHYQLITIVGNVITRQKFDNVASSAGSGSWSGSMNAILADMSWSASVVTTGFPPLVGGYTKSNNIVGELDKLVR